MFPDRMADGIIASFFIYCFEAGPSQCSFFTGSSALSIFSRFSQSFVRLNPQEAKAKNWANATDIESALLTLKTALSGSVASPVLTFSSLSDALVALEQAIAIQNVAAWTEAIVMLVGDPTPAGDANAEFRLGTLCTDQGNKWYKKSLEDLYPAIEHLREVSIIGEIIIKSMLGCLSWSIKAAEVYSGPFGGDTQTPILFVGNTYDPVSPVTNALAAAPKYKDAQVVTVDATGHTSRMTDNTCQKPKVNAYFQTTQLPGNDSYCALEAGSLGIVLNATLEDIINQASLSQLQVG
ncbi:TAP-like protein-domain-containing protein [Xylaria longipes]|nr:TAP-like protein-domain-containing protein [Xylaria longipes]